MYREINAIDFSLSVLHEQFVDSRSLRTLIILVRKISKKFKFFLAASVDTLSLIFQAYSGKVVMEGTISNNIEINHDQIPWFLLRLLFGQVTFVQMGGLSRIWILKGKLSLVPDRKVFKEFQYIYVPMKGAKLWCLT